MTRHNGAGLPRRLGALCLVLALLWLCAAGGAEAEGFYRMDRDSREAWRGPIANLRLLTRGQYAFGPTKARYHIDPDFIPSTEGLDGLDISGSAQFSEPQLHQLATTLRKLAKGKRIYVIDLRQESHAFLNGHPISWYDAHNWANAGLTLAQICRDEAERFGALVGSEIHAYGVSHDYRQGHTRFTVHSCVTEQAAVEDAGFEYLRLPAPDMRWPPAALIDDFIEFIKGIDMEQSWLHFHCHAGTGRTGIFMMLYDGMKNPAVPMEDIIIRHVLTGSEYPLYHSGSGSFHDQLNAEKARMMPLLFQYVEENRESGYAVSWSDWLAAQ